MATQLHDGDLDGFDGDEDDRIEVRNLSVKNLDTRRRLENYREELLLKKELLDFHFEY